MKAYTQKKYDAESKRWDELAPKTTAAQVVEDSAHQFISQAEKDSMESTANKNQPNGYAGLDANGKLPAAQIPDRLTHDKGYFADENALQTAYPTAQAGDFAIIGTTDTVWIWDADSTPACWVDSMRTASERAKITISGTEPANPSDGDFWFDTSSPAE